MAPQFGTSGLRGLAVELTNDLCARYAAAFCAGHVNDRRLFVGRDRRDSSERIAAAVAQGAAAAGLRVVDCGILPTPALARAAFEAGTISIMVTGSHIPADRNGLKFYTSTGEFTKADEIALAAAFEVVELSDTVADVSYSETATASYVTRYTEGLPKDVLAGLRLGVWLHSSAASEVLPMILEGLGADVVRLGASDHFVPVDTEAVAPSTRERLAAWVDENRLDGIVSTDGDADRPLVMDDSGILVPGDILGPVTARWLKAREVVTTVSANSMVEKMGAFAAVHRTRIGSPYVIAEMESCIEVGDEKVAGYEPNGGFLLGWSVQSNGRNLPALMTRDCVLPIVGTFAAARLAGGTLSQHLNTLPARRTATDRLQDVPREVSERIVTHLLAGDTSDLPVEMLGELETVDQTDGVRMRFAGAVVHIRPSGNAPELRCYVEAENENRAQEVLAAALAKLRQAVG